jgi:cellulose biosynthesis protein BcsQ/tetratricopeptide (TPR) repeat protein
MAGRLADKAPTAGGAQRVPVAEAQVSNPTSDQPGTICTFYSYKGGVGRTLALANIAVVLARWGYRVLCVDWDLEAPGLHLFFKNLMHDRTSDGVVELICQHAAGERMSWQDHVISLDIPGTESELDLMPAGRLDHDYAARMQALDWEYLYAETQLGEALERVRAELKSAYDFVLVDSRTGITDIGGICTVQLPDLLVFLFTASHQSLEGSLDVVERAAAERQRSSFDRAQIPALPVITRFEMTVEVDIAREWMRRFEERLAHVLKIWVHREVPLAELLPLIRVPHVAKWSFGERLPALEEGTADPQSIGYAFESLAALIANQLQRSELFIANRRVYVVTAGVRGLAGEFDFDAYVSSSTDEHEFTTALIDGLRARGQQILTAETETSPGERLIDLASRGLARARNLVLVIGRTRSPWLEADARQFLLATSTEEAHRRLFPVLRSDPAELFGPLANQQALDARQRSPTIVAAEIARIAQEQLFEVRLAKLGEDHPQTLETAALLVGTRVALGDLRGARELQQRSLTVQRRLHGDDHTETISALAELATLSDELGLLGRARELHEEVLAARRRVLGEEHPDTLTAMGNLAQTLRDQGELGGARELGEQVLKVSRRVLGEEHPATLTAMGNLAQTLRDQGELGGARELQEQVLKVSRRVLGKEHPATLAAMGNLAQTLWAQGELGGARELGEQVLEVRCRVLGEEHPDTLTAMGSLAQTLRAQGELGGARELQEQVLKISRRVFGEEHPTTLIGMRNLVRVLRLQGERSEAAQIQESLVAIRKRTRGIRDPVTLAATQELAEILVELGQAERARALLRQLELAPDSSADPPPSSMSS